MTKAVASMKRDEKTRNYTDDGEPPKKEEYLLLMKLAYEPTNHFEDKHDLGIFTQLLDSYCTTFVADNGSCRHRCERLWYQYFHWSSDRLGIDRPSTIDACSWAPGGKALVSDVRAKIWEQQIVKREKTLEDQMQKMSRGVKRDCTQGRSTVSTLVQRSSSQISIVLRLIDSPSSLIWLQKKKMTKAMKNRFALPIIYSIIKYFRMNKMLTSANELTNLLRTRCHVQFYTSLASSSNPTVLQEPFH